MSALQQAQERLAADGAASGWFVRTGLLARRFLANSGWSVNAFTSPLGRASRLGERHAQMWPITGINPNIGRYIRQDQMTEPAQTKSGKFLRGIGVRQVRLACGLVLFAYLVSHFVNHALGNVSTDALAAGVHVHTLFWQFLPVAIAFYAAALIHTGL